MRFELPAEKKLVHQVVVPMRWGDMDAMGHVNNTQYFRYMEVCRLDWTFKARPKDSDPDFGIVIVNTFCNFLRQLEYPGDVVVKLFTTPPGRSSFESFHTLERSDAPGVRYAEGGAQIVWTDRRTHKSAPLPGWLRALL
jgi:acyl-CoA thioester hydrolase